MILCDFYINRLVTPWTEVRQNVLNWDDTPPQAGKTLVYRLLTRNAQVSTAVNVQYFWGGSGGLDTTATNYHIQRAVGADNAQSGAESTGANGMQQAAASNPAGYYSFLTVKFPWFRRTDCAKKAFCTYNIEVAGQNQQIGFVVQKRQGGSIVGSQLDPVLVTRLSNALANATDGILLRCTTE